MTSRPYELFSLRLDRPSARRARRISAHSATAALLGVGVALAAPAGGVLVQGAHGTVVSEDLIRQELAFQPETARRRYTADEEALRSLIDDIYRRAVLVKAAERLELTRAERYRVDRAHWETMVGIAIDRRANELLEQAPDFSERAEETYLANLDQFRRPAQWHVRHILFSPERSGRSLEDLRGEALDTLEKLRSGAAFAAIARERSDDAATAPSGGDLGWASRGRFVPAFEEAAFALAEPGDLSDIVETPFGLHIIQLVDRREESVQPFEEVKDRLIRGARADWLKGELQAWKAELTDPEKATVHRDRLDAFIQSVLHSSEDGPSEAR